MIWNKCKQKHLYLKTENQNQNPFKFLNDKRIKVNVFKTLFHIALLC